MIQPTSSTGGLVATQPQGKFLLLLVVWHLLLLQYRSPGPRAVIYVCSIANDICPTVIVTLHTTSTLFLDLNGSPLLTLGQTNWLWVSISALVSRFASLPWSWGSGYVYGVNGDLKQQNSISRRCRSPKSQTK